MFRSVSIFGIVASLAISGALPAYAALSGNGAGENGTGENGTGENGSGNNGITRNGGGSNGDATATPAGSSTLSIQAFELPPERK